jgi:ubiquinone/menaquinone biosynthesis C-methylase UbiE
MVDSFEFSSEDNVLEIGCGSGYRLYRLNNQYGIKGKGIDISSACIKYAIRLNEGKNDFYVADAESLPFGDNIFDFLLCIGVLEHMPHPSTVISEIFRVLKPGGQVLIWTPIKNCKYSFYWFSKRIFPQRVRESDMRAGHDPARFLSSESLIKILENNQLRVEKIQLFDAFFQPFYDYFILAILDKIAKGIKKAIKTMKSILQRKNQTTTEKGENSIIKKAQPKRFSIHSYLLPLAKVFLLFDKPLYKIGIGASIFIIACKKSKVIKYNT